MWFRNLTVQLLLCPSILTIRCIEKVCSVAFEFNFPSSINLFHNISLTKTMTEARSAVDTGSRGSKLYPSHTNASKVTLVG